MIEIFGKIVELFELFNEIFRNVFLIKRCCACGKEIFEEGAFCRDCRQSLSVKQSFYPGGNSVLDACFVAFTYDEAVKDMLRFIKFAEAGDKNYILSLLAEECRIATTSILMDDEGFGVFPSARILQKALWTTVPTVKCRLEKRGFDIPIEIFGQSSKACNKEIVQLLYRRKNTEPLYSFAATERKKRLKNSFIVGADVKNRDVLLMDDIFTTGSTLNEAAGALKRNGARKVWGLCFSLSPNFSIEQEKSSKR